MPYLSKYDRYFFWLGMSWWYLLPFACFFTSTYFEWSMKSTFDLAFDATTYLLADFYLFVLTRTSSLLRLTRISIAPNSLLSPVLFHLAFTIWTSLWVGNIRFFRISARLPPALVKPHFEWPMVLAAIATVLYFLAFQKGHQTVFSRTLGGPGIEPMSLILHSSEPEYNAITDEGRIQLT